MQETLKSRKKIFKIIGGALLMGVILKSGAGKLEDPKDITFTAKIDGSEQHYVKILPDNFDQSKSYDLIIGLHGHGQDRWQFAKSGRCECAAFRNIAAKYGMIAVTPDYRAKTSWMGPKAEADLMQIIENLKKKYKIRHLFLIGASMGGTSVLTFAVLHPDTVDGVTSMNGLANHLDFNNFQDVIAESFGGTKDEIPEEYKKRSAEFWPEKLTMPIAFTTGGQDKAVPPASVLRLVEKLKQQYKKVLLIHRPKGGHETNLEDAMTALEFMYNQADL